MSTDTLIFLSQWFADTGHCFTGLTNHAEEFIVLHSVFNITEKTAAQRKTGFKKKNEVIFKVLGSP